MSFRRIEPKEGQESVWDYPRPPRVEQVNKIIRVVFNGEEIVNSGNAMRVLETSHPPVYYIPQSDIHMECLKGTQRRTYCEFKGEAMYWTVFWGNRAEPNAGWSYPNPRPGFEAIKDHIAFYASRMDACYVGDEQVQAQEGDFYGGWVTSNIVGPFKGGPGTWGW
jgi:uncharacterized protein (DUF427 family)